MFSSRDGMIWLGTWELGLFNLYKIDPLAVKMDHDYLGISHACFYEDSNNNLYVGGFGLSQLDKNRKIIKQYVHNNSDSGSNVLSDNSVLTIEGDKNGIMWLGTDKGGLNSFNPKTTQFKNYRHDPANKSSISPGQIFGILEDNKSRLWICTLGGLNIMNRENETFTHFKSDSNDVTTISSELTTRIVQTKDQKIWIGSINGMNLYNESTGKFRRFLPDKIVIFLYEDSENTLWVGSHKGLFYLKKGSEKFEEYINNDHQTEDPTVTSIIEDNQKNLWLTNYLGIKILNPDRTESITYSLKENWNFSTTPFMPVHKLKNGDLLYGNASGIFHLDPEEFPKKSIPPQLVITSIKILNKEISESYDLKEISLDHYQNTFSFTYSGIQFSKPEENQHLYKLEGYDDAWRKASAERTAYFYNIPPGTYTLTLAAANSNGKWTEKNIKIIIAPPFWNTWWFRIVAILAILGIFYAIVQWRIKHKYALQLQHSQQEKQLADLKRKTSELEINALRAQMNPHFIFNSLNSINRFILQNNKAQASEYLTKFSKLVRQIFHNSEAPLVTLENELDALKLYLELEAVRFDNQFKYEVIVDEEVEASALKVPPLIIQPYAENAIWHGLMHKEENGHLTINISLSGDILVCSIKDDGIGRKKAGELESKTNNTHKSMGMRITSDRITLLQEQNLIQNAVVIKDLELPDGGAGGTEIIIKLPVRYD